MAQSDLNKPKAVIGLSGGMDSSTLLGYLLYQGYEVHACTFKYGSKHNPYENKAAEDVVAYYKRLGLPLFTYFFDLTPILGGLNSALLASNSEGIPEGHYADENMRKTVVPGRNMLFASTMASLAESINAPTVALGVHSGDHFIYPDCRTEFIKSLDTTVFLSTDKQVQVIAPFHDTDKEGILNIGYHECTPQVPYHLTRTCYKDQEVSCGKCGSCNERLEAFENIGIEDPIEYEI